MSITEITYDTDTEPLVRRTPTQEITVKTDTRVILANATKDIEKHNLNDYFIVDVDAHHVEQDSWPEIAEYLESPVLLDSSRQMMKNWPRAGNLALWNNQPGLTMQDVSGRIPHQAQLAEETEGTTSGSERDVTLVRRAMDAMGIDIQIVFPQPMLEIGLHPNPEIGVALLEAYNRWFTTEVLPRDPRIKTMLGLPFEDPQACLRTIEEYSDHPGVIGFLVTSQRHAGVHQNKYMPVYRELERLNMPLGFHAGPNYTDTMTSTMNKFLSAHAMSFTTCSITHLTNWVINGIPERFPGLKVIWIESGLAWIPFMMQRLDHEYLMRQSDAPLLTKKPSEYMKEMYYTTQPLEATDDDLLQSTLRAMDAKNTLMYSSDWPHWDFDVPSRIAGLPFLDEEAKRNILGETARKVFNL